MDSVDKSAWQRTCRARDAIFHGRAPFTVRKSAIGAGSFNCTLPPVDRGDKNFPNSPVFLIDDEQRRCWRTRLKRKKLTMRWSSNCRSCAPLNMLYNAIYNWRYLVPDSHIHRRVDARLRGWDDSPVTAEPADTRAQHLLYAACLQV